MTESTLFELALRKPARERAAFLDEACAGDAELRRRLDVLLQAHDNPGGFLEGPAAGLGETAEASAAAGVAEARALPPAEEVGGRIGPYRLLQAIGEGGMGSVFMAEQTAPVKRLVALKVIKAGMDSRQVLARFEAERQALALMDHPNIARVLDAGATEHGRPYFVMELVRGVPITSFCDDRRLTPRERLELFIPVCQAVQHAHQKGVIHRDIKPSNVLVALYDDRPVPKVIDFGVAKAAGVRLSDQTLYTEFGAIIGTLQYMSPEQAQLNQLDIDTRSDVYSLGVLLYELLTGTTPLERGTLGQAALLDVLRLIREADTPRPSARLSTAAGLPSIAAARGVEPRRLSGLVRGDLDWVVMRALEKDRSRRYETANALARDLQRHLEGAVVEACPPTPAYRLRRFARRHRAGLAVGAAIAATLIVATAVSVWQALRATRAERDALQAARIQALTNEFFLGDLLDRAGAQGQSLAGLKPDPDIKVRTLVDRAAARIDGRFEGQPLLEAEVRRTIGNAYRAIGMPERGREQLEKAYELGRIRLGEDAPSIVHMSIDLAVAEVGCGLRDRAAERLRRAIDGLARDDDPRCHHAVTALDQLGVALDGLGRLDEADVASRRALDLAGRYPGLSPGGRLSLSNNRAIVLMHRGSEAEAEALLEGAVREAAAAVGEDHPMLPNFLINLGVLRNARGDHRGAERDLAKAVEAGRRIRGDRHPITLAARRNLGLCLMGLGRRGEAEATLRSALEDSRASLGAEDPATIAATVDLAEALARNPGRAKDAESLARSVVEASRRIGPELEDRVLATLGVALIKQGRFPEAEATLARAVASYERGPSPGRRVVIRLKLFLSESIAGQGRHAEAIAIQRGLLRQCEAAFGPGDALTFDILLDLIGYLRVVGGEDEALALSPRAIAMGEALGGAEATRTLPFRQNYGALLHVRGRFEEAEAIYRGVLDQASRLLGPDDINTLQITANLGELYRDWGRPGQAVPLLTRALEATLRVFGPDHWHAAWVTWKLAELERDRGRPAEAEPMFRRAIDRYAQIQGPDGLELAALRADLAMNHLQKGEPAAAEPLLRQALAVYEKSLPDDWRRYETLGLLGQALALQGRFAQAEPLVLAGYEGMEARRDRVTVDAWPRRPQAGRRVRVLYERWGKAEKVDEWDARLNLERETKEGR
ncbi:Serine/threonine-protein kinase PknB [Aquisphaera giovannonii]|uniref:Serine/threonine-protein kinase PknB n=1 Tax=Aquisphaera giovannonii TaxID=406548 RepID=A0A5B9VXY9_9BACT|nr:serine/threonine-protein kinase [Aquisphaera giovannonii]QEH32771.1 Serine/threonine-protein kinase PknB [Aquisphaera giovannonii]